MDQLSQRFTHSTNSRSRPLRAGRAQGVPTPGETLSSRRSSRVGDRRSTSRKASERLREWSVVGLRAVLKGFSEAAAYQPGPKVEKRRCRQDLREACPRWQELRG